jgi:hypothetical protein
MDIIILYLCGKCRFGGVVKAKKWRAYGEKKKKRRTWRLKLANGGEWGESL